MNNQINCFQSRSHKKKQNTMSDQFDNGLIQAIMSRMDRLETQNQNLHREIQYLCEKILDKCGSSPAIGYVNHAFQV